MFSYFASAKIDDLSELAKHFEGKFNMAYRFNVSLELMSSRWISRALTDMFISQIHTHKDAARSNKATPNIHAAKICHDM